MSFSILLCTLSLLPLFLQYHNYSKLQHCNMTHWPVSSTYTTCIRWALPQVLAWYFNSSAILHSRTENAKAGSGWVYLGMWDWIMRMGHLKFHVMYISNWFCLHVNNVHTITLTSRLRRSREQVVLVGLGQANATVSTQRGRTGTRCYPRLSPRSNIRIYLRLSSPSKWWASMTYCPLTSWTLPPWRLVTPAIS